MDSRDEKGRSDNVEPEAPLEASGVKDTEILTGPEEGQKDVRVDTDVGEEPGIAPAAGDEGAEAMDGSASDGEPDPSSVPDAGSLAEDLAETQAELARTKDRMLRIAAEFENYRKRAKKEASEAVAQARKSLLAEILPMLDNLERALSHADQQGNVESIVEGIRMVQRQAIGALEKYDIRPIEAMSLPFDPNFHEAVGQSASTEHPAGMVMEEWQRGYMMGDRLLRPSAVVVSVGPVEEKLAEINGEERVDVEPATPSDATSSATAAGGGAEKEKVVSDQGASAEGTGALEGDEPNRGGT